MQTELTIKAANGEQVELYHYGDGDVCITIHNGTNEWGAILRPADVIQIAAFCREAFERGKTNED